MLLPFALSALVFAGGTVDGESTAERVVPEGAAWSAKHPISIGLRGLVWGGEYVAPGFGGHLRIRPFKRFGVELFADHTMQNQDPQFLHDNVIGFHAFFPLLKASRFYVAPTLGACVDFRVLAGPGPDTTDLRFAPHAGVQAEWLVAHGVSVELAGTFYGYLGNDVQTSGWTSSTSSRLNFTPTGQATLAVNYTF
jgi:hypothetical protein